VFQNGHTRAPADADPKVVEAHKLDWAESAYIGPMFLYMFYGFYDGMSLPASCLGPALTLSSRVADMHLLVHGIVDEQFS
jgi:hypothetical protein